MKKHIFLNALFLCTAAIQSAADEKENAQREIGKKKQPVFATKDYIVTYHDGIPNIMSIGVPDSEQGMPYVVPKKEEHDWRMKRLEAPSEMYVGIDQLPNCKKLKVKSINPKYKMGDAIGLLGEEGDFINEFLLEGGFISSPLGDQSSSPLSDRSEVDQRKVFASDCKLGFGDIMSTGEEECDLPTMHEIEEAAKEYQNESQDMLDLQLNCLLVKKTFLQTTWTREDRLKLIALLKYGASPKRFESHLLSPFESNEKINEESDITSDDERILCVD